MKDNLAGAVGRLVIFVLVCALGFFAMMLIFAQLRFQGEKTYRATFTDVSGLAQDDFVRIAGVEVGKVKKVSIEPSSIVSVEFSAADSVTLTEGTRAAVRWADVFGGRYLSLEEGSGGLKRLKPGETIPTDRTLPALDLDALIGGFPFSGAGSRAGQRPERATDCGVSGPGYDGEIVSRPDGGSDEHTG
jgi:phospholipid/cholesterol/gamma-HCH transport system substrate-binding protein